MLGNTLDTLEFDTSELCGLGLGNSSPDTGDYRQFIQSKRVTAPPAGFNYPRDSLISALFPWQADIVQWAIHKGRAALFLECGLGKTICQLEWARAVCEHTGEPVLIVAPMMAGWQTVQQAEFFSIPIPVKFVREAFQINGTGPGIYVTNYERIHKFNPVMFGGIVLDESSILKSFMGKTKQKLMEWFHHTPYKLCCTATPAPNDLLELGNHADFLNVMPAQEMIARWFINDTMHAGNYRLKNHGEQDFWRWISSWAVAMGSPSDLGFPDDGFDLPPLNMHEHIVDSNVKWFGGNSSKASATNVHREKRDSLSVRCGKVAELCNASTEQWAVWCGTNYEADELRKQIKDCVEIRGDNSETYKEDGLKKFQNGSIKVIITKAKIGGFGLNWQHCHNTTWFASYSFEEFYQAIRRLYRFRQLHQVNAHIIASEGELEVLDSMKRKVRDHEGMKSQMAKSMRDYQIAEFYGRTLQIYQPTKRMELPSWMQQRA